MPSGYAGVTASPVTVAEPVCDVTAASYQGNPTDAKSPLLTNEESPCPQRYAGVTVSAVTVAEPVCEVAGAALEPRRGPSTEGQRGPRAARGNPVRSCLQANLAAERGREGPPNRRRGPCAWAITAEREKGGTSPVKD